MMKKLTVLAILIGFELLNSLGYANETVVVFTDNVKRQKTIRKVLESSWKEIEREFKTKTPVQIKVGTLPVKEGRVLSATTLGDKISVSSFLSGDRLHEALRHESAHVYLNQRCGQKVLGEELVHEMFAQWVTKDFHKIASSSKKFYFINQSTRWLRDHDYKSKGKRKDFEEAIARLLKIPGKESKLSRQFKTMIRSCRKSQLNGASLISLLELEPLSKSRTKINFILSDNLSSDILINEGNLNEKFRPASTLKPLLLSLMPSLMVTKANQQTLEWACPDLESLRNIREWKWEDALSSSCNGFFLDHERDEGFQSRWADFLNRTAIRVPLKNPSLSQMIGLLDGIRLSLLDQVKIFNYIKKVHPHIISALKKTALDGTVKNYAEAQWFRARGISLKTGSVRSSKSVPLESWIVAVSENYTAAIHSKNLSTKKLIQELYQRLKKVKNVGEKAELQILGLVPLRKLEVSCSDMSFLLRRPKSKKSWGWWKKKVKGTELKEEMEYSCPGGALMARFPTKAGAFIERKYFGSFYFTKDNLPSLSGSLPTSERRKRARRGSRILFRTSMYNYVTDTVISEFPRGKDEVIKAIALVIKNNIQMDRHKERPICDTTHCQVFGRGGKATYMLKRRIQKIVLEVLDQNLTDLNFKKKWRTFSLGGSMPWNKYLASSFIKRELGLKEVPLQIEMSNGRLSISLKFEKKTFSCENFRNQLRLPSCPKKIRRTKDGFEFRGNGEGHGLGMDLQKANVLASQGESYKTILKAFYKN